MLDPCILIRRIRMRWLLATPERRTGAALMALCLLVYLPLSGAYGLWDPWETHYGEVARQMLRRGDWISTYWPCSPDERPQFWSKPILTFWLLALAMRLGGLEAPGADPGELVSTFRVEWAMRLPFVVLGVVGVWAVWRLVSQLAGRRAGVLAALVLATSSQWVLVARQAVTDMPFVVPMTVALALAGLAVLEPDPAELPRRTRSLGRWSFSWPHAPAFYGFVGIFSLVVIPQFIDFSIQLSASARIGGNTIYFPGIVVMFPYIAGFVAALAWCARARRRRQLLLHDR
jgi:4-amino-4-deoxy-L-arabinose transferase-like glycosyltransferase